MRALGEAATELPWLCPCAAALTALARAPADAWGAVRHDPALVLLVARQTAAALADPSRASFATLVHDPAVLEGALTHLHVAEKRLHSYSTSPERERGDIPALALGASRENASMPLDFVNWADSTLSPIHVAALTSARLAHGLAQAAGGCDPESTWAAALLTPLGWYAVCAANPEGAAVCLRDPAHARHAEATQQRFWGLDAAALGRRLAQRWALPRWLGAVVGHLSLPVEVAERLGADPAIFRIVQLAVGLVQQRGHSPLQLPVRPPAAEVVAALGHSPADLDELLRAAAGGASGHFEWESPHGRPLLREVLALAAENRRLKDVPAVARLQQDADELHQALARQYASEAERLRAQKLAALAEFAAGAGHEINNPLAVISGQAQYLLKKLASDEARATLEPVPPDQNGSPSPPPAALRTPLQTIIQQTKRIHQILTELMQFARPPRPRPEPLDVAELVREAAAALFEPAERGQVRLVCPPPEEPVGVFGDRQQVRTALTCLLRNAVESAPPGGWAGVRVEVHDPEFVELVVEDNGSGPAPAQREHLFDPFYSGRHAGRGRGLGLPTAWRLAREHGGDVRCECRPDQPTRFVLSLPRVPAAARHAEPEAA